MILRIPFKLLWLIPLILAAAVQFTVTPARGQQESHSCSSTLGQQTTRETRELSDELEILSWNIQKASNIGWAEDLASFSDGVDLAFIQEASVHALIPDVIPADLFPVFAAGYTTASQQTGVMTLSAGSPSSNCKLTSIEPWLRTPKATSITEYTLQDREDRLLAINLHAVNFDLGMASFRSQLQALEGVLTTHLGPVILAGDLNTWSDSRQVAVDDFMRRHGLGSISFEPDLRTTAFGRALDHIYVRGMSAQYAKVIPVTSSDHNPLRVRLAIQ